MLWEFSEEFFTAFPQNAVSKIQDGYIIRVYIESLKALNEELESLSFRGDYYICNSKELRIRFGAFERFFTQENPPEIFPIDSLGNLEQTIDLGPLESSKRSSIPVNIFRRIGKIPFEFSVDEGQIPSFKLMLKTSGNINFTIFQQPPYPPLQIPEEQIHPSLRPYIHNSLKEGSIFFMNIGGRGATAN